MPPPKYRIRTKEDYESAKRWLVNKFKQVGWPNVEDTETALATFLLAKKPEALQAWCDIYLAPQQWKRIRDAIRAARRNPEDIKNIKLDVGAWQILSDIAKRDNTTYSDVIYQYLKQHHPESKPPKPAAPVASPPPKPSRSASLSTKLHYRKKNQHEWDIEFRGNTIGTVIEARRGFWVAECGDTVCPAGSRQEAVRDLILKLDIQGQYKVEIMNL